MSSSTTPDPLAIRLQSVSKIYRLHGSQSDQLIDVLGLKRFGLRTRAPVKEFAALSDFSLAVPKGHRIGIIGRNGAGKTTLLKLICGNFAPTTGEVEVNGSVQALMSVGLGFHPEYTGRENVEASLQYNGLPREEYKSAMQSIVEFCELGDFLDQPFKSYSLGMQARLMFATATAVRPDILIVDEVLSAGDAYFVAKSKLRVENLVRSGCTMLLVSHSMQQILELCDEAIWLDHGRIRMQGESFLVVKAYEEYLHGPIKSISTLSPVAVSESAPELTSPELASIQEKLPAPDALPYTLQEPTFRPHAERPELPHGELRGFHFEAPGGISRWQSEAGVKVVGFAIITERGLSNQLVSLRPALFVIDIVAERDGPINCCYGVALNDHLGRCVSRIFSTGDQFFAKVGTQRRVKLLLNPCQLGPGEYTVGISVTDHTGVERLNEARRYDLLSRSFLVQVALPDSLAPANGLFFHTAEWSFNTAELP